MALLYAATLFLSAALLMMVQPLCARLVLPTLGGTPNVWNTCMVFFQTGLLAGYGYAHLTSRIHAAGRSVFLHVALLAAGFWMLPIVLPAPAAAPQHPALWLLQALVAGVALPYFVIAATGPLLQRWFAAGDFGNPYFLYAASNAGSFVGLLSYPVLVEPWLTLEEQSTWWRWGYLMLLGATLACGAAVVQRSRSLPAVRAAATAPPPAWRQRLHWLVLAFVPSSLLLSVTNYITADIAAIPLLWIIPLGLYLLTFTLVFATRQLIPQDVLTRWLALAVLVLMLPLLSEATEPLGLVLGLHLLGFFWLTLVCHGELARTKPAPAHLTEFYFWLALGGALGGVFNALLAPLVFSGYAEYPLMIALAALLKPSADSSFSPRGDLLPAAGVGALTAGLALLSRWLRLDPGVAVLAIYAAPLIVCYLLQQRPIRFGLAIGAIFLASLLDPGVHGPATVRLRSFFGVHRVTEGDGLRRLVHGNTVHGQQFLDTTKRREPLAYYHRTGPIGTLLKSMEKDRRLDRVALIGLGAGSLAAYVQPGQRWTFFEIDPAVQFIARDSGLFTFLRDAPAGSIDIVLGDARLTLGQSSEKFGVLIVDAFGSDAIPWHLLTRQALELYQKRLQGDGILAFHISNRYVDLEPVLANHAQHLGLACTVADEKTAATRYPGKMPSIWVFLAKEQIRLPGADFDPRAGKRDAAMRPWTDDFADLLQVLQWRGERD
ncbi:MAG: fused MFS/spermidine synthase [Gemmataceae bacterium]|nr:fused MFS/spermidine synthase [Gemmataceae bacterium]